MSAIAFYRPFVKMTKSNTFASRTCEVFVQIDGAEEPFATGQEFPVEEAGEVWLATDEGKQFVRGFVARALSRS